MQRKELERLKTEALYAKQRELTGCADFCIGVDEVGRGCVAGPLSVGAVVLPLEPMILGVKDSKKLTPRRREVLAQEIRHVAKAVSVVHVPPSVIDERGIMYALQYAMLSAVKQTGYAQVAPVLIDGRSLPHIAQATFVVKGDDAVAAIAAASIVAKVTRDKVMTHLARFLPAYHFASNKGYGTAEHIRAIREVGLSPYHRKTFCENFLNNT